MRNYKLISLFALSAVMVGAACSSDPEVDDSAGGNGGAGPTTTTMSGTPTTSTMTGPGPGPTTTTAGGGMMNDNNNSFAEAEDIDLNTFVDATLGDPTDYDYYKFNGTAGEYILVIADAKPDADPFADGYPDTVVTLFDAAEVQLAMNDDPIPRTTQDSTLLTRIATTGLHYIEIVDFCEWSDAQGSPCPMPQVFSAGNAYQLTLAGLNIASDVVHLESEGAVLTYEANAQVSTGFSSVIVLGTFDDAADVDTYSFTPPAGLVIQGGRETTYVEMFPSGTMANGSTAATGLVYITAQGMAVKMAELDAATVDPTFGLTMNMPVTLGTAYDVHVATGAANVGTNGFYEIQSYGAGSNDLETEPNDTTVLANAGFMPGMTSGGFDGFFVGGDGLIATDDFYRFTVPAATVAGSSILSSCSGLRSGSGLLGLTLTVLGADGTTVLGTSVETATDTANLGDMGVPSPAANTDVYLQVSVTGQSPTVTGTHYQCGLIFVPPGA